MSDTRTTNDHRVGTRLGQRYRLEARVASGGMATVYRATDEVLGRPVAIKVMHPALTENAGFVERFRREAQAAARLNHPNVVTVHDGGEHDDVVFIVMELVEGTTLRQLIERFGRLDPDTTRHVVSGVAAALDHAHAKGLVHRDVKPENVLLTSDGHVKVVDFGVARALAEDGSRLTGEAAIGTMSYIAPEQLTPGEIDRRADVYALGVMTYEMLSGKRAFDGDTPAAVAAARFNGSVPSPGVSPEVDGAVAKATALRPDDRFDTAGEFARALGGGGSPTHLNETTEVPASQVTMPPLPTTILEPSSTAKKGRRKKRSRRRWPWLALVVLLLAGTAGAGTYLALPRTTEVPDLAGWHADDVEAALVESELALGTLTEVFDEAEYGTVLRTEPPAGAEVPLDSEVAIWVSKGPELFPIPSVAGQPLEEARAAILEAGFTVGEESETFHNTVPAGHVVSQEPAEGEARKDTPIALVVSKGPDLVAVPQVAGKSLQAAKSDLEGAGFAVAEASDFSDSVSEGLVIRSDPAGGRQAVRGARVTVVVSKGPRPFPMPNLVGMSRDEAKAKATELGLVVANEYAVPGSGRPSGQVQGQNPPAGSEVRRGARIDLYYSA